MRRLGVAETKRRLVHMGPGLLPLILVAVPHSDPLTPAWQAALALLVAAFMAFVFASRHAIARQGERSIAAAVAGYAAPVLVLFLLLPGTPELGLSVLVILAFGDGIATCAGMLLGRRRLPWNPEKSWAGLVAFLAASLPLATLAYWSEARPAVSFATAFACVAPAAIAGALAESVASRINDNTRVALAASAALLAAHAALVGW